MNGFSSNGAVQENCKKESLSDQDEKDKQSIEEDNVDFGSSGTIEDTAIKIIRVFANVSINPEAGTSLALCENIVDTLLEICKLPLHPSVSSSDRAKYENILLPTLATLNNLSFYPLVHQKEAYKILKNFLHPQDRNHPSSHGFSSAGSCMILTITMKNIQNSIAWMIVFAN